ncbi:MAG: YggT family protein [Alphaproteobacteria bacterium]|nr:MAG: YggT family protein [Alphaproteobacteria bacterium]
MSILGTPLLKLLLTVLSLYKWAIIAGAILSILQAFTIVNGYNRFVLMMNDFIFRITEPLLAPIRRFLPHTGSIDLSPLVLILLITFLENVFINVAVRMIGS